MKKISHQTYFHAQFKLIYLPSQLDRKKLSKLSNWSLDYWLANRLVPEFKKLTNRSPNFSNICQIGPSVYVIRGPIWLVRKIRGPICQFLKFEDQSVSESIIQGPI